MSDISFCELDPHDRYKLLCGVVVPRPIALVTTLDENGAVNAAPFSFFNVFSEDPPLVVLGLQHEAGAGRFLARTGGEAAKPTGRLVSDMDPERNSGARAAVTRPPRCGRIER